MVNNSYAVTVDHLRVTRGGRTVIPDLSVAVPTGQVVGLLGPSGGGKSTFIRSVVGVQVVESGTVTVLGEPAGSPALRHRVGYVTQSPSVYGDLSVADNVRYFGRIAGADEGSVQEAIALVDLASHAGVKVENLSGGQHSRASLACALVGRPELLVLDEPTVGLDPVLRRDLWALFAPAGLLRDLAAGFEPRDGRGDPVRPAAAHARGGVPGRLHPRAAARRDGCAGRGDGVPHPDRPRRSRECGMNARLTLLTAGRVLRQIRGDRRTVALMVVVPCVLIGLLAWIFNATPVVFDHIGPALLGVFPFVVMFIVTSVATLRERTSGTLERLLTTPIGKGDFMAGYGLAFGFMAVVQALVATGFAVWVCGLDVAGPVWLLVVVAVADAVLGTALGLLASGFARTEFQAVQFMPAFVLPQFLLCGLLVARDALPDVLRWVSDVLPLSYAVDAMKTITSSADAARGRRQGPRNHRRVDRRGPRPGLAHPATPDPLSAPALPVDNP